jgi:hypothetical protein
LAQRLPDLLRSLPARLGEENDMPTTEAIQATFDNRSLGLATLSAITGAFLILALTAHPAELPKPQQQVSCTASHGT